MWCCAIIRASRARHSLLHEQLPLSDCVPRHRRKAFRKATHSSDAGRKACEFQGPFSFRKPVLAACVQCRAQRCQTRSILCECGCSAFSCLVDQVMLAASFWTRPHFICLDEPTNYLDTEMVEAGWHPSPSHPANSLAMAHHVERRMLCGARCLLQQSLPGWEGGCTAARQTCNLSRSRHPGSNQSTQVVSILGPLALSTHGCHLEFGGCGAQQSPHCSYVVFLTYLVISPCRLQYYMSCDASSGGADTRKRLASPIQSWATVR